MSGRETWQDWLRAQRAGSTMTVERVPLSDVKDWGIQDAGARFGRPDGKFFNLVGAKITNAGREVQTWGQPLIEEMGEGAVVVFAAEDGEHEEERYLVSARAEPGNAGKPGLMLLGPSLQASRSNLEQAHGGKRPPRAELLDNGPVGWITIAHDGGRNIGKTVRYAVVEVKPESIALLSNERWFTREELQEAMAAGDLSEHLIIALFTVTF